MYLVYIIRFSIGINQNYQPKKSNKKIPISVIIAVKNGGESVPLMLNALSKQIYDGDMEFIIIDDNSTDNTKNDIINFSNQDNRFQYVHSNSGSRDLQHKKRALDAGIKHSKYEHLLFTDIDCIVQSEWIASTASLFTNEINYIIGHAYVNSKKTLLNKFQRVDLLMLLFASYGSTSLGAPWASTGQNQAYTKTLYNKIGGFNQLKQYLQGDDTLFLQLAIKHGAQVAFNSNPKSYVISRTETKWINLLQQRARWSGDANVMWKFNINFYLAALATFNINLIITMLIFTPYFKIGLIALSAKVFFETIMYISGMKKLQYQNLNYADFICWSLMVPVYTVIMGVASFFNVKWKGSSVK